MQARIDPIVRAPRRALQRQSPPGDLRTVQGVRKRLLSGTANEPFRIALCVPLRGSAGIWAPSSLASAQLAEAELNCWTGIAHRPCEMQIVDASAESADVEATVAGLLERGEVDALVGMCTSPVRQRIAGAVAGRLPFIYTCLYEGGETTPGLFAIGETAARQLRPSIAWLAARGKARRWTLVGNDFVWPRVSHAIARRCIAAGGNQVVADSVVPLGCDDYSETLDLIRRSRSDAVLISLVGQDAVDFNRAFGGAGLARDVARLSCAIEENMLLAIGAENTENLHVALGYFESLDTEANHAFKQRYHGRYRERAPTLNSVGQSLYEGLHFLAGLAGDPRSAAGAGFASLAHPSARTARPVAAGDDHAPIYLARAEGHAFRVIARM